MTLTFILKANNICLICHCILYNKYIMYIYIYHTLINLYYYIIINVRRKYKEMSIVFLDS